MPKLITSNSSQIGVVPEIQLNLPNLNEAKPKPEPKTHNNYNNENHRSNENYRSNDKNRRFQNTNEAAPEKPQYRPKENSTPPKRQNVSFNKGVNEKENIKPAEVKQNAAHLKNEEPTQCPLKNGTIVAITALEKSNCTYIRSLEEKANGLYMNVINQFMGVGELAPKLNKLPKVNDMVRTDFMQTGFYRAKMTKVENEDKDSP